MTYRSPESRRATNRCVTALALCDIGQAGVILYGT
jgi:hypothetical protein